MRKGKWHARLSTSLYVHDQVKDERFDELIYYVNSIDLLFANYMGVLQCFYNNQPKHSYVTQERRYVGPAGQIIIGWKIERNVIWLAEEAITSELNGARYDVSVTQLWLSFRR